MASRRGGIIPIEPFGEPPEGRRALQYEIDLTSGIADIDLTDIVMQKQLSKVQTIYFDNGSNNFEINMSFDGTLQRITFAPYSQGYINLLLPNSPKMRFTSGFQTVLKVSFLNFIVPETTWGTGGVVLSGVTSVGLALPTSVFDITGSPVTSTGTLTGTFKTQLLNTVFAGPTAGAPAVPAFRALVAADIPALPYAPSTLPTRQILTAGTGATYNTPAGVRQLRIRMIGGGGGGAGVNNSVATGGTQGGTTSFDNASLNVRAIGGAPAGAVLGGYAIVPGGGAASYRAIGAAGTVGWSYGLTAGFTTGGIGGSSQFGGGPNGAINTGAGTSGVANTGVGGSGASNIAGASFVCGGGGQAGEYVELIINNPAVSYLYSIGAGGAGGVSTQNGGAGASGIIIVDEYY